MLADDHNMVRTALRRVLEATGEFRVVAEAATTEEADRAVGKFPTDVAIVDIELPTRGGLWLIRSMRATKPDVRVVALTAHRDESYVRAAFAVGAAGFVSRSEVSSGLLDAIRKVSSGGTYVTPSYGGPVTTRPRALSKRELSVVQLIAKGFTNKEAAAHLDVSVKTIETLRSRAMAKLGLATRHDLFCYAHELGLLGRRGLPS